MILQDKKMIYEAFPSLSKNLAPVAAAYGLKPINLPDTAKVSVLDTTELTESTLASIMAPLDVNPDAHLCVSLDAEWNISRRVGVSVIQLAPHSEPDSIFIIPVCHTVFGAAVKLTHQLLGAQIHPTSYITFTAAHLKASLQGRLRYQGRYHTSKETVS
jgi:hypothetical protein